LFHYRARHFYRTLNRAEQIKWQKYRRKKLEAEVLRFEQSLQELVAQNDNNEEKLTLLQKVYEYGNKIID
jgi:exodeoxyribonuclease I